MLGVNRHARRLLAGRERPAIQDTELLRIKLDDHALVLKIDKDVPLLV